MGRLAVEQVRGEGFQFVLKLIECADEIGNQGRGGLLAKGWLVAVQ